MPTVSIVIPIWNQRKIITQCFNSLYRNWSNDYELIIVNDNSDKETTSYLHKEQERFRQITPYINYVENTSGKQWYFTRSIMEGIRQSCPESKYLLLLNSDTIITKNAILLMLETFKSDNKIAVVGPTTSDTSSEQKDFFAYQNKFNWWNNWLEIEAYATIMQNTYGKDIQDINLVGGFCLMIRKDIYNKIPFDQDFLDYGGEKYHQICCRQQGYRTIWCKAAYVHHFAKASYTQDKTRDIGKSQKNGDQYIINKMKEDK